MTNNTSFDLGEFLYVSVIVYLLCVWLGGVS